MISPHCGAGAMLDAGHMLTNKRAEHSGRQRQLDRQVQSSVGRREGEGILPRLWGPGMPELENASSSPGDLRPCRLSRVNGKQQMCLRSQRASQVQYVYSEGWVGSGMGRSSFGSHGYKSWVPRLPETMQGTLSLSSAPPFPVCVRFYLLILSFPKFQTLPPGPPFIEVPMSFLLPCDVYQSNPS